MALRDLPFVHLTSVFVLDGLEPRMLQELPAAFETVVRGRRTARRRWPSTLLLHRRLSVSAGGLAARRSIHHVDETVDDAHLAEAARSFGFSGIPVSLTITPTRCAIATAHGVYDGYGSVAVLNEILEVASGAALGADEPQRPFGLLRATLRSSRADLRRFITRRSLNRAVAGQVQPTSRIDRVPERRTTSSAFELTPEDRDLIRRAQYTGGRGRPTINSRICALAVTALREVSLTTDDLVVSAPTDLRHWVQGTVEGNFFCTNPIGTLKGDWAPGPLATRLAGSLDRSELISLLSSWPRYAVQQARRRTSTPSRPAVTVSMLTTKHPPAPLKNLRTMTVASFGDPNANTFVFAWHVGDRTWLSLWDASGRFDLSRFEPAFRKGFDPGRS